MRRSSKLSRSLLVTVFAVAFALPVAPFAQPNGRAPAGDIRRKNLPVPMDMRGVQVTNIPYFSQVAGTQSELGMNNNTPHDVKVQITIFNAKGTPLVLPATKLKPGVSEFKLEDLTKGAADFDSGNLEVMYDANPMALACHVGIFMPEKRISFESRDTDRMDFASSQMNGIVWFPDEDAEAFLALTNTATAPVTVDLSLGSGHIKEFSLTPRQTRLLNLSKEFDEQETRKGSLAKLLRLSQSGAPGAVIGTGFVLNVSNGYSSGFTLVDPATSRSTTLSGAGMRFGFADADDGFPVDTKFRAPLVLANVGKKPLTARVSVDYTVSGTPASLGINEQQLRPGELKIVDVTNELAQLGITGPVDDAGVDISFNGAPPGSLIAHLTSVDQTGDYSFELPIKDPFVISHTSGNGYPWSLKDGTRTVVHLKNASSKPVRAVVEFSFAGGKYSPDRVQLQPFQTLALDIENSLRRLEKKE